jgi:DNA-binding Lrp family transcriptional regulator
MPKPELDQVTIRILDRLQRDSEISIGELAEELGISSSPCWRRVRSLKQDGTITRSVALVDPAAIGLDVSVFVQITLEKQTERNLRTFSDAVRHRPEVMECYLMSGEADYLLRVVVEDVRQYQRFVVEHLTKIPGVASIKSSFALDQIKYTTALPTAHLRRAG